MPYTGGSFMPYTGGSFMPYTGGVAIHWRFMPYTGGSFMPYTGGLPNTGSCRGYSEHADGSFADGKRTAKHNKFRPTQLTTIKR